MSTNDYIYEELEGIELGAEQQIIYRFMELSGENIFVTGKAGTGKSVLLKYFAQNTMKKVIILAPTGVAAMLVKGQTLHSRFAFNFDGVLDPDEITEKNIIDDVTKSILNEIDAFVIDEISMVRADVMECVNRKFQLAKNNKQPFGGVQMIIFGDLYQLPPVVANGEIKTYFENATDSNGKYLYGGEYFFFSRAVRRLAHFKKLKIFELEHIYRQKDKHFQRMLNEVRIGMPSEDTLLKFNERRIVPPAYETLTIATKNAKANEINGHKLDTLPGELCVYGAACTGDFRQLPNVVERELSLKVGAQVVMLRNDSQRQPRWVNGTLAEIAELSEQEIKVKINGAKHNIERVSWRTLEYCYDEKTRKISKQTVAEMIQFPIRLAWAMTIHKSQGQTYKSVTVDLDSGAFVHGQAYVALSRCESLDELYLAEELRASDIIVDRRVDTFIKEHMVSIPKPWLAKERT